MKIVGITACTAGIAHTYLVREKLVNAARELGHEIKIETQGSIGVEDILDEQDILHRQMWSLFQQILKYPEGNALKGKKFWICQ